MSKTRTIETRRTRLLFLIIALCAALVTLPVLIVGNQEKETLNDTSRAGLTGSFIRLSDGIVHYEYDAEGHGPVVVLIHGNAAPMRGWDHVAPELYGAGFRVLRFDVFGHGYSDRPALRRYDRELYDRQVLELLDALDIQEPVMMAGTSQGGAVAAYFGALHPERVSRIAFLAPLFDTYSGARLSSLLKAPLIGEYLIALLGDRMILDPSAGFADPKSPDSATRIETLVAALDDQLRFKGKKRAVLANIRGNALSNATESYRRLAPDGLPCLLTWGNRDRSIGRASMEALRELMPRLEYHELEGAAHLAHVEYPDKVNPLLIEFFMNE